MDWNPRPLAPSPPAGGVFVVVGVAPKPWPGVVAVGALPNRLGLAGAGDCPNNPPPVDGCVVDPVEIVEAVKTGPPSNEGL